MSRNKFKQILTKMLMKNGWVVYDNKDEHFKSLEDDEIAICGEDEKETFAIKLTKVKL